MSKTIVGVFENEDTLVDAIHKVKAKGIDIEEVYTPYPVFEVLDVVGKKSRIRTVAYFYGLFAALSLLAFLYYTSVISWPINYGGKPVNSFPSFIIITLVLTIFSVTVLSLFTFSVGAKLFPGQKAKIVDERATDDKFVLVVQSDKDYNNEVNAILKEAGALEIKEN
ncbi:MAG: DUF3341 domain-containing protein [Bacteroidales bacterium]|nr:DUF3341 domain-containing protein [Bacteroidales bacterium]